MNTQENKNQLSEATFTVNEVAGMLNISNATLLRWLKAEKVPGFFRIGRKWLIRKVDLEKFISRKIIS